MGVTGEKIAITSDREMWSEVIAWLKTKFKDFDPDCLQDKQLLPLHTAMTHDRDCLYCTDIAQCPHSRAKMDVVERLVEGYREYVTGAVVCPKMAGQSEDKKLGDMLEESLIPRPRRRNSFSNFETLGTPSLTYAKGLTSECADNLKGLILGGPVGCGKTHLAIAYGVQAVNKGHSVLFVTMPELLRMLKNDISQSRESKTLEKAKNVDVLILDDAGIERGTDWGNEQLYMIVDHRYGHSKPIVLTTNARGLDALQDDIGNRSRQICSRLLEMCEHAWIEGVADYRKIKAEREMGSNGQGAE